MDAFNTLIVARSHIARGWCIGSRAKAANGSNVRGNDPSAVRWCALGAIDAAANVRNCAYMEIVDLLAAHVPPDKRGGAYAVAEFNNSHNQAEVLALFDKAIAAAASCVRMPNWNALAMAPLSVAERQCTVT